MIARRNLGTVHTAWNGRHALVDIGDIRFGGREWKTQALCRKVGNPSLWFPDSKNDDGREAKEVCMNCPVRMPCLDAHIDEPYGIWGGLGVEQRRTLKLRREQGKPDHGMGVCARHACRKVFLKTRPDRIFCSDYCQRNQSKPNHPPVTDGKWTVCSICGDRFLRRVHSRSLYCSDRCRRDAKNAQSRQQRAQAKD